MRWVFGFLTNLPNLVPFSFSTKKNRTDGNEAAEAEADKSFVDTSGRDNRVAEEGRG